MSSRLPRTGDDAADSPTANDLDNELREMRLEIAALRAQLARRSADVDELRKRLRASRSEAQRYSDQLRAMRGSSSWRVTRPLRMWRRKSLNDGWT